MDPPTFVHSVEVYHVGSTIRSARHSQSLSDEYYQFSRRLRGCVGETMRAPFPWLDPRLDDPKSRLNAVLHFGWIDQASIATYPGNRELGQNSKNPTTHPCDTTIVANSRALYPEATPSEWLQAMPVCDVSKMVPLNNSAIESRAASVTKSSKRRVSTTEPTSKRVKRHACALKVVGRSAETRRRTFSDNWQRQFELLCSFQREHGHSRVPETFTINSVNLGNWVKRQRCYYQTYMHGKNSQITEARIAQLNVVGFQWRVEERTKDDTWQHKFDLLCAFQRENGHCLVPPKFIIDSVNLGPWVRVQRRYYRQYKQGHYAPITKERITLLNSIGFGSIEGHGKLGRNSDQQITPRCSVTIATNSSAMQCVLHIVGVSAEIENSQTTTLLQRVTEDMDAICAKPNSKHQRECGGAVNVVSPCTNYPLTASSKNANTLGGIAIKKPRRQTKTSKSRNGGLAASLERDEKRCEREDKKREPLEKVIKKQEEKKATSVASSSSSAIEGDDGSAAQQQHQQHVPGSGVTQSLDDPLIRVFFKANDLQPCERPDGWIGAYSPERRRIRLARFLAKRPQRVWTKTVKYDVRKNISDNRLRVKGRFIKSDDELIMRELISLL